MKKGWTRCLALALVLLSLTGTARPALADRKITLTFTGDVTLGGEERRKNQADSFQAKAEAEGYDYFFARVRDLFAADDLTVVNLEGVLSDSERQENKSKTYRFRGPTDYAKILTGASIESCSISNNHIQDFGRQGYKNTVKALEENGLRYFGADVYDIYEKDGIKIAFFSFVSPIIMGSRDQAEKTVKRLKEEEGVNAVVVCLHVGNEYSRHRSEFQERYGRMAVSTLQADLVIMHHPHVVQGIDVVNNRYICYSLGNFCFGGNTTIRALETMAVQADLIFEDDGTYKGQQLRLYPAHTATSASAEGDPNDYQPTFVSGDQALRVLELVQIDTDFDLGPFDEETGYLGLPYLPAETGEEAEAAETAESADAGEGK